MHDPYRMVFISILTALLLGLSLIVYRYKYPKKKVNLFILLLLLSFLPLISLLRAGTYESGDLTQNVYKAMSFYQSLSEGNFFPQWAGELNATYGYPLFIFVYPLPFYLISIFHFIGFSFISSIKLLIASTFIASGVGMYLWIKEDFGKLPAFTAALFYLYAPYHLVDMHFRVSIGELVSFTILPFILLSITKYLKDNSQKWFIVTTLTIALLLLCNQAIALISFGFLIVYTMLIWYKKKNKSVKTLINISLSFIFALALSAFYWLPVIIESKYTHQNLYAQTVDFVQLHELLYSPWIYGFLFQGNYGELSFLIGYIQLIVISSVLLLVYKKKFKENEESKVIFYLTALFVTGTLMLPIAKPIWDNLPLLKNFQFTYRLLLFASLFTAVLAAILTTKLNKSIAYFLCVFVVLQTMLNWGNRGTIFVDDTFFMKTLPMSTQSVEGFQPAVPKWVNTNSPWQKSIPVQPLEILDGDAEVIETKRISTVHTYTVLVDTPTHFKENTWYFPGWNIYANDKLVPVSYNNPQYPGIMTFELPKGKYKITVAFSNTEVRKIAQRISIGTFIIFLTILLLTHKFRTTIQSIKR